MGNTESFVFSPNFNFGANNMCNENVFVNTSDITQSIPPPGNCFFLLADGSDFLLSDNSNFLLACDSENYFVLADGTFMLLSDGTNFLLA